MANKLKIIEETKTSLGYYTEVSYDGYSVVVSQLKPGAGYKQVVLTPHILDRIVELESQWEKKYRLY